MNEELINIKEGKIRVFKNYYLNLGVLIAVVLWLIAATAFFVNEIRVVPLEDKVLDLSQNLIESRTKNRALSNDFVKLKSDYSEILKENNSPNLLFPYDGAVVIGNNINFRWDYSKTTQHQNYILDIRSFSNKFKVLFNVLNPEQNLMNFPTSRLTAGEYIWRIIPGKRLGDETVINGSISNYRTFQLYNSVFDKIKKTQELRVGISPSLSGFFNYLDDSGNIIGFDPDFIQWVSKKIAKHLKLDNSLKVVFVDTPWDQLLVKLRRHEVDVMISSMTSTQQREDDNRGVRFSKGYYETHQVFIRTNSEGGLIPDSLVGKIVGVTKNTTNESAAKYLIDEYKFNLRNDYSSYSDLYSALEQSEIDFALVDDVLVSNYLGTKFYKFGGNFSDKLKGFYRDRFKRESEMYAIAVAPGTATGIDSILEFLNKLIESSDGQKKIEELSRKWISTKLTKP